MWITPTITISDRDNPNWAFRAAGNVDILETSAMGDCFALIIVNPDGSRILAHLPAGDLNQVRGGGGLVAMNALIVAGAAVTIIRGLANLQETAYFMGVKYQNLLALAVPAGLAQTQAGFFAYADVSAAGVVNFW